MLRFAEKLPDIFIRLTIASSPNCCEETTVATVFPVWTESGPPRII